MKIISISSTGLLYRIPNKLYERIRKASESYYEVRDTESEIDEYPESVQQGYKDFPTLINYVYENYKSIGELETIFYNT